MKLFLNIVKINKITGIDKKVKLPLYNSVPIHILLDIINSKSSYHQSVLIYEETQAAEVYRNLFD